MDAIASAALRRITDFGGQPQEIANIAWSFSPLDWRHRPLLAAIAAAARRTSTAQFCAQELANTPWSFAALKVTLGPLLHALAAQSISRISQVTTQNLVNTAWALEALAWRDPPGRDALSQTLGRFLENTDSTLGLEWVTLAALAEDGAAEPKQVGINAAFLKEFHARVLDPALELLARLRCAGNDAEVSTALAQLQDLVVRLQLPHLGQAHTRAALTAAGAGVPSAPGWLVAARLAVKQLAWWSCPHAAVSSQGVVAWVTAHLEVVGGACVNEAGRLWLADDAPERSILLERMLRPVFLQVPRGGHAERRALLGLMKSICQAGGGEAQWEDVHGVVNMYVSHYPCISCLACMAQFGRRMPAVRLEVDFDNAWEAWEEHIFPTEANVLSIGRAC